MSLFSKEIKFSNEIPNRQNNSWRPNEYKYRWLKELFRGINISNWSFLRTILRKEINVNVRKKFS